MAWRGRWAVVADDRTGALEVAGAAADAGVGPVGVMVAGAPGSRSPSSRLTVIDLGSRHLAPEAAARAAADVDRGGAAAGGRVPTGLHKIDSTLRGNWPHELLARAGARGGRVLLVPALPALGRCCVDGEVREHGRPVAERTGAIDVRRGVASSRPAELLRAAGATAVAEVMPGATLDAWLHEAGDGAAGAPFAVCDATTDDDLTAIARAWVPHAAAVLFAGTSASIAAAVAGGIAGRRAPAGGRASAAPAPVPGLPWLVVAGSLHPASAAQLDALVAAGARTWDVDPSASTPAGVAEAVSASAADGVLIVRCDRPAGARVDAASADAAAAALARAAAASQLASVAAGHPFRTVVVIGGDTAAAVLGDAAVEVGGTVAPGVPWARFAVRGSADHGGNADDPLLVTKAGAFGDPDALVRLLPERNAR